MIDAKYSKAIVRQTFKYFITEAENITTIKSKLLVYEKTRRFDTQSTNCINVLRLICRLQSVSKQGEVFTLDRGSRGKLWLRHTL